MRRHKDWRGGSKAQQSCEPATAPLKKSQRSLKNWTKQKWRTKSGKPSGKTGERYLPEKAIKALSSAEYAATTRAKRKGTKKGKQFVKQQKNIAKRAKSGGSCSFISCRYIAENDKHYSNIFEKVVA